VEQKLNMIHHQTVMVPVSSRTHQ